jgi:uncharacterized membrane protein
MYFFIIWLIGVVLSYILVRKIVIDCNERYTVNNRLWNIFASCICSWCIVSVLSILFVVFFILELYDRVKDNDAKW